MGPQRGWVKHPHMNEKVTPFPLPPSQLFSFRMGGRVHVLVIPAMVPGRKPKRAEVIPISTTSPEVGQRIGTDAKLSLHSAHGE